MIPQLLTLMAEFSTLMAFPVLNWAGEFNFFCYQVRSVQQYQDVSDSICSPLYLNSELYWKGEDTEGWAGALMVAALFGILASALGFMALALLLSACCFELSSRRIGWIVNLQLISAFFAIMTLVGGVADACKGTGLDNGSCDTDKVRMATGAGFMLFAFFLFCSAAYMTRSFHDQVQDQESAQRRTIAGASEHETKSLTGNAAPIQALGGLTVTKSVLPGGQTRIEREYLDEGGQLVKEVTIEEPDEQLAEEPQGEAAQTESISLQENKGEDANEGGSDTEYQQEN